MMGEVSVNCVEDSVLIVPLWHIAWNPRKPQFVEYGRDILVLEFDGPVCATDLRHEGCTMPGFYVRLSREIGSEHGEVVRNNSIEFVVSPGFPDLFFIGHLTCPDSSGKAVRK